MSSPTEQLIREYISRLSVAAQGRLSREDRRALIDRTRGYIEHNTGLSGPATPLEVGGVLARLGDPALVVAHEVQRLADIRGDAGEPPPVPRHGRLARVGRLEPGRLSASWHWPARPGNLADLQAMLRGGRAGAPGSRAALPGEADVGDGDAAVRGPDAPTGMQTAYTQTAGAGNLLPISGLEALGLIGSRQDDAGSAAEAPGIAGPAGIAPAGPGELAGRIPAQAGESASLNGTLPDSAQSRFAAAGRPAAAAPQRPSWPHDPAIRRDAAGPEQAKLDAEDRAAVEAEDQAAVQQAETDKAEAANAKPDELAVLSAPGFAGEAPWEPDSDVTELPGSDAGDLTAVELTAVDLTVVDPTAGDLTAGDLTVADLTVADPTAVEQETVERPRFAQIRSTSAAVVGWTRDKTLESVATILLGLGGLIFPPIWLLGAALALASKVWDYRDKWVGLAVPIVLTMVGTAAGVILAGSHSSFGRDLHVGWVSADIASRVSAVLGAIYLAWRSVHGRRPDAVPPWNKPHRIG
jgi:hypothetical protein